MCPQRERVAVLDYDPSSAFLYLAHTAGLVHYTGSSQDEQDVISILRSSRARRHALDAALLYEGIDLISTEEWDTSPLDSAMPTTLSPYPESDARSAAGWREGIPVLRDDQVETARMLKRVLLPRLRRKLGIKSKDFDQLVGALADPNHMELAESVGGAFLSIVAHTVLERELLEATALVQRAGSLNGGIVTTRLATVKGLEIGTASKCQVDVRNLRQAYGIVCDEVKYFPVADNLEEALELRNDRRVSDFRDNVWRWTRTLQNGECSAERTIRAEIGKANEELRHLKKWRQVTRFLTYVALPLAMVPYLGLPVAVLGAVLQAHLHRAEWRHRWVMLGRQFCGEFTS